MPRTRADDRADKHAAILAAARARLQSGGYEGLSLAAIARELGVAQNTVYWYFPSKDHLFVAALESLLDDALGEVAPATAQPVRRILWFTEHLAPLWPLFRPLYDSDGRSEVVEGLLARVDEVVTERLTAEFRELVSPRELAATVAVFRSTVDGVYARGLEPSARRLVLRYAAARLTRDPGRPGDRSG